MNKTRLVAWIICTILGALIAIGVRSCTTKRGENNVTWQQGPNYVGLKWGSTFSDVKHVLGKPLYKVQDEHPYPYVTLTGHQWKGGPYKNIYCYFWNNHLMAVYWQLMSYNMRDDRTKLFRILREKYGEGARQNRPYSSIAEGSIKWSRMWIIEGTIIELANVRPYVIYSSISAEKEILEYNTRKNREDEIKVLLGMSIPISNF